MQLQPIQWIQIDRNRGLLCGEVVAVLAACSWWLAVGQGKKVEGSGCVTATRGDVS